MIVLLSWIGAAFMVASSFIINTLAGKLLAIAGLSLLSIQAVKLRAFNLLLLNVLSIIGFIWSIFQ